MGEMADYYADLSMLDEFMVEEEIQTILTLDNDKLVEITLVKDSTVKIIKGIRDYFYKHNKLSDKQRYVLAKYICEYEN